MLDTIDNICFFFKQKTAYEMRISDWSSDVCSSDLLRSQAQRFGAEFKDLDVRSVDFNSYPYKLTTDEGEIQTKSVIIATGANALWLNAKDADRKSVGWERVGQYV